LLKHLEGFLLFLARFDGAVGMLGAPSAFVSLEVAAAFGNVTSAAVAGAWEAVPHGNLTTNIPRRIRIVVPSGRSRKKKKP